MCVVFGMGSEAAGSSEEYGVDDETIDFDAADVLLMRLS